MGQKVPPGLVKRGETWHIWKTIVEMKSSRKHWNERSSGSGKIPSAPHGADQER